MAGVVFTNSQEAEQAFYDAFQRADLDAMMAVWAEDEEVFCIHPGGPRLTGLEKIRESFRQIFRSEVSMRFAQWRPDIVLTSFIAEDGVS